MSCRRRLACAAHVLVEERFRMAHGGRVRKLLGGTSILEVRLLPL